MSVSPILVIRSVCRQLGRLSGDTLLRGARTGALCSVYTVVKDSRHAMNDVEFYDVGIDDKPS